MTERLYYPISEVCRMLDLKPHVLRYWETAFPMLTPHKNKAGNRVYRPGDVRMILFIKKLLYEEGYTIDGARKKLEDIRKSQGQMSLELDDGSAPETGDGTEDILSVVAAELRLIIATLSRDPMQVDGGGEPD